MEEFERTLKFLYEGAKLAINQKGRQPFPLVAPVIENRDPDNLRRIKVLDPTKAGQVESEWVKPLRIMPSHDTPVPRIGDTVLLIFLNGDPLDALYIPFSNAINSPLEKPDAVNDLAALIPGNELKRVVGDLETTIQGEVRKFVEGIAEEFYEHYYKLYSKAEVLLEASTQLMIQGKQLAQIASEGCSITLAEGVITWSWAGGTKTMIMGSNGDLTVNLGGGQFNIQGASGLTVNGNSIATIGAQDSRGDTLVTKGWT